MRKCPDSLPQISSPLYPGAGRGRLLLVSRRPHAPPLLLSLVLLRLPLGVGRRSCSAQVSPRQQPAMLRAAQLLLQLLGACLVVTRSSAALVTIDNTVPRLDVDGAIVNSHDGTIRFLDGEWWLHAASYGTDPNTGAFCDDPPQHGCGIQRVHHTQAAVAGDF